MDIRKAFAVDKSKELDGVWVQLDADTRILVARLGNERYRKVLREGMAPYRKAIKADTLSEDVQDKIMVDALVEGVLLDWEGMAENGKTLPYSKDTARRLLSDPALKDFRDFVVEVSNEQSLFKEQLDVEAVENLKP